MTATGRLLRSAAIFLFLAPLSNSIASAGDYASRAILGFSADGRYFAFEQYGVQDGSGFPYSEIFIIDTGTDRWVPGTPLRIRLEQESPDAEAARRTARADAAPLLGKLGIAERGEHLASNPRAELSADSHQMVVNHAHRFTPPKEEPITFRLTEKVLASAECGKFSDQPMKGFSLVMEKVGEAPLVLHEDETLPASRGCALGYGLADVLRHEAGGKTSYAVLLHVQTLGFEGPDSRFLAVTRRLP